MKPMWILVGTLAAVSVTTVSEGASRRVERRVRIATEVVEDRMNSPRAIPPWLLDQAQCLASLKIVKAGFIFGGEGSTGLVSCRLRGGEWSAPSFFNIGGVNFGLQIGVQFMESVLVFLTEDGRRILENPSFRLGTDLSFAAGPVGGGGGTGVTPDAHVLGYSHSVGLYAGATIDGVVLSHGVRRNREVYGNGVQVREILRTPGRQAPHVMSPFVNVLETYAP